MPNYKAIIASHYLAESKEKHTPSIRFVVNAFENMNDGTTVDKNFTIDLWLSEKAAERTMKTLRNLGFQGDSLELLNCTTELVGVPCELTTEWVEHNGKDYEKPVFLNEDGSKAKHGFKSLPDDAAKRVCNRYDAMLRQTAKKKSTMLKIEKPNPYNPYAKAAQLINQLGSEPVTDDVDDEDLPFNQGDI